MLKHCIQSAIWCPRRGALICLMFQAGRSLLFGVPNGTLVFYCENWKRQSPIATQRFRATGRQGSKPPPPQGFNGPEGPLWTGAQHAPPWPWNARRGDPWICVSALTLGRTP
eukprot:8297126-Pyramimonas_sp.AAC.2